MSAVANVQGDAPSTWAWPAALRSALILIRLIYLFMVRVFGWLALLAQG